MFLLIRNGEEILHVLCVSAKFIQRETKAFPSSWASPHPNETIGYNLGPYLCSLDVQMNFVTDVQITTIVPALFCQDREY